MEDENKPMDEFEWEQFLKKNDEMVDKFSALMEKYIDDPNCDEIIAKEMGWDHLLDDKENESDDDERPWLNEMFDEETEESEAWKIAAGIEDDRESSLPDFRNDPLYQQGLSFAVDFMNWFRGLPETIQQNQDMNEAIANAAIPGAKIAGAVSIGGDEDKDQLGMRLAIYKRGLIAANKTVAALSAVKEKNIIELPTLFPFIKQATTLRNGLAIRVLEIRDRFNSL